jgi:beta-mannosidase
MNEGGWNEPKGFPKTRSVSPAQIEINGENIFAKGSNWVNPEIFPGTITKDRYKELIALAVDSNFNILRTWGGSVINKDSFFELCDEMGIFVWQEFPLACNLYPDDDHYLSILKQEATFIVKRLRKHPSIGIWCGGNELFNSWSKMTDQSLPLRLLNSICYEYDPKTPYNPTSPLLGMAHGHYVFRWEGMEVFEMMDKSHNTAYSEFGMPGISPREVLEKIIPEEDLFPPKTCTAWEEHHAFGAWDGDISTWLCQDLLTEYMGEAKSLDELIGQSQLVQSEGYKAIYEEARRKKPYCSMALNWCFNEPWPSAANNSLVVYPSVSKPSLDAVKNSCRPFCSSAKIYKFVWNEGEEFYTDIWFLNDELSEISNKKISVKLVADNSEIKILEWESPTIGRNENMAGPTARFVLPKWKAKSFRLVLEVESHPEYNSSYDLMYRPKEEDVQQTAAMNVT